MIHATLEVFAPEEWLCAVKEGLAMWLEAIGPVRIPDIRPTDQADWFLLCVEISTEQKNLNTARSFLEEYVTYYRDLRLRTVQYQPDAPAEKATTASAQVNNPAGEQLRF